MLKALGAARSATTPRYLGGYHYHDVSTGADYPLGLIYRYFAGDGLDVPLRGNLRSLWDTLPHALGQCAAAARAHVEPLAALLRAAGAFLFDFHAELAALAGPPPPVPAGAPEFDVPALLDAMAESWNGLAPMVRGDPALPPAVRDRVAYAVARRLERFRSQRAAPAGPPFRTGLCHGDLHLSHFLHRPHTSAPTGRAGWQMCIIDVSTPCLDACERGFLLQSPWQDIAALERALEYFTADEAIGETASRLGLTEEQAARAALLPAGGADAARPAPWPRHLYAGAAAWRAQIRSLILDGYTASLPGAVPAPWIRNILRMSRLLHELTYNYAHDRSY
jgi:maltokinase